MDLVVRPARIEDEPRVVECVTRAFDIYVKRIGRRPAPMDADYRRLIRNGQVFMGEDARGMAGVLVLVPQESCLYLDTVAVHPSRQGHGIGRRLLRHTEASAVRSGYTRIELCTNERMVENIGMYRRYGYVEIRRGIEDEFGRVYFSKSLNSHETLKNS